MVKSPYAHAIRCPVLSERMVRSAYAMSGTDLAYGATSVSATIAHRDGSRFGPGLLSAYALATPCPVLG
eukprot:1667891-Rhodomonas_salina.1